MTVIENMRVASSRGLVFVIDAAADYLFVNQATFIELIFRIL